MPRKRERKRELAPRKLPIDRGAPASLIMEKFGSLSNLARATGKTPSTVHRWLVRGHIDGKHHAEIMAAAEVRGVKLKPSDFVDTRDAETRETFRRAALSETE